MSIYTRAEQALQCVSGSMLDGRLLFSDAASRTGAVATITLATSAPLLAGAGRRFRPRRLGLRTRVSGTQ